MYLKTAYFDEVGNPIEINIICEICNEIIIIKDMSLFKNIKPEYCLTYNEKKIECSCGNYDNGLIELKKDNEINYTYNKCPIKSALNVKKQTEYIPMCPTCSSPNIKKISNTSKVSNTIIFGIFGTKRYKIFHCNNCGYEW